MPPGSMPGIPCGVSFSPENEQIDTPLLIRVPGGDGWLVVGGGPVISPANDTLDPVSAAAPIAIARIVERLIMTDPQMLIRNWRLTRELNLAEI